MLRTFTFTVIERFPGDNKCKSTSEGRARGVAEERRGSLAEGGVSVGGAEERGLGLSEEASGGVLSGAGRGTWEIT